MNAEATDPTAPALADPQARALDLAQRYQHAIAEGDAEAQLEIRDALLSALLTLEAAGGDRH